MIRSAVIAIATTLFALPPVCAAQTVLSVGQTLQDRIHPSDPTDFSGIHHRCYPLQTRAGYQYRVAMSSLDFPPALRVLATCGGGTLGIGSALNGTAADMDFVGDGEVWLIAASGAEPSKVGRFSLSVAERQATVYFSPGSASLSSGAQTVLNEAASQLTALGYAHINIIGYTDQTDGSAEVADRLSQTRIDRARQYLMAHGVPENLILAEARGDTEQASQPPGGNRRIVVEVKRGSGW